MQLTSLFLLYTVPVVYGNRNTGLTSTPTHAFSTHTKTIEKRDPGVATITLGPVTQYLKPQIWPTSATKSEFFIVQGPEPTSPIDVYMGPDLLETVKTVVDEHCKEGVDADCEASVAKVLPLSRVELKRRTANEDMEITSLGILGHVIGLLRNSKRDVVQNGTWQLASFDQFEGMSASPSSTLVILSEAGDAHPLTLTSSVAPQPTVSQKLNGDVVIGLDQGLASIVNALTEQVGKCSERKRSIDVDCVAGIADFMMRNAVDGVAADLIHVAGPLPHPGGPEGADILRALQALVSLGKSFVDQIIWLELPATELQIMVIWMALIVGYGHKLGVENTIPAKQINRECTAEPDLCRSDDCEGKEGLCTKGVHKDCLCRQEECPPEDRTPSCRNCGGNDGNNKCLGLKRYNNLWKGCKCIPQIRIFGYVATKEERQEHAKVLANIPMLPPKSSSIVCNVNKQPMTALMFSGLIEKWCQFPEAIPVAGNTILHAKDSTLKDVPKVFENLEFAISYRPKSTGPCMEKCSRLWLPFLTQGCSDNSTDEMAETGEYSHDCGLATYHIQYPPDPGPQPPFKVGKCTVIVTQWNNVEDGEKVYLQTRPMRGHNSTFSVAVEILDAERNVIGKHDRIDAGDRNRKDRHEKADPLDVKSKLEHVLTVTPEISGDYVQFSMGSLHWPSNNKNGSPLASCNYPQPWTTQKREGNTKLIDTLRRIECTFECKWDGGKPSDGL